MTITNADRERFQSTVTEFHAQPEPDQCFPSVIKNILDELADRQDNSSLRYSVSDIGDALDYVQNRAAASDRLASRLDPLLEDAGFEINVMTGVGYDQLQSIIESEDRSLPVCELHEQYFEDIGQYTDAYTPEPGMDGFGRWPHVVIPFKFNDNTVLYFDPYIHFFHDLNTLDDSGAIDVPFQPFNEWWARPNKRWALWVEPMEQQTLAGAFNNE